MLKDKVCLVTGGSRGIGRAVSELFAASGALVFVNGLHAGGADAWIAENPYHERLIPSYFDVSDEAAATRAVRELLDRCRRLDVLVNSAGVEYNAPIGMISGARTEEMFRVNVFGTIHMLQLAARVMRKQEEGGSIVNIASMTAVYGNPGQLAYTATKGAVLALTRTAAKELMPHKIRVNAVAPGLTDTDMLRGTDPAKLEERIRNIPAGRIAGPEDIARACLYFASGLSGYVSGQILGVDGCAVL